MAPPSFGEGHRHRPRYGFLFSSSVPAGFDLDKSKVSRECRAHTEVGNFSSASRLAAFPPAYAPEPSGQERQKARLG